MDTMKVIVNGIDIANILSKMWEAYEARDYVSLGIHTAELLETILFRRRSLLDVSSPNRN